MINLSDYLQNNIIVIIVVVTIIAVIVISYSGSNVDAYRYYHFIQPSDSNASSYISSILIVLFAIFLLYLAYNQIKYISEITSAPSEESAPSESETHDSDDKVNVNVSFMKPKQVFNISDNKFTYTDAKAVCKAYGARLATYKEIEDAYNAGGEWCNYGWSDGQMTLFPTQQETYDKLQKIKGSENACGRPGVNGGYEQDTNKKFGVNCYGIKPSMTPEEEQLMATRPFYPRSPEELELEKKVNHWKNNLNEITISPFNQHSWSKI